MVTEKVSFNLGNIFLLGHVLLQALNKVFRTFNASWFLGWGGGIPFMGKEPRKKKKKQLLYYLSKPKSKLQIHLHTLMLNGWKASREMES